MKTQEKSRKKGIPTTTDVIDFRPTEAIDTTVDPLHQLLAESRRWPLLTPAEEVELRALAAQGVTVTAQDVPSTRPVPLDDVLSGGAES